MSPPAISRQNSRSTSRRSDGFPGDFIADLPVNAFIHPAGLPIDTSTIGVLRPPVESAQYTSAEFRATLTRLRMRASMGRVGSCYDNAVAESFFATLKAEIGARVWATRDQARQAVFAYLSYYNHDRLHSTLKHRTPYETRVCYRQPIALAA